MIRISVHLISAVDNSVTELARMDICNVGADVNGNGRVCHYAGVTYVGRSTQKLDKGVKSKTGRVMNWRRHDWHVWNLVARMLSSMKYDNGIGTERRD